jgi:FdhD protein
MRESDMQRRSVVPVKILEVRGDRRRTRSDQVAGEEPMEIRIEGAGRAPVSVAVTMRTPGHDFELACGFLFSENLVALDDVARVAYCIDEPQNFNVVTVQLRVPFDDDLVHRNFYATSSCGICGKASLEHVAVVCESVPEGPVVPLSVLAGLPDALRSEQRDFDRTGGLHGAALFDSSGGLIAAREDIGRHNAVDKVIGHAFMNNLFPLSRSVLMVSGRAGFEIVQKAAVAGIPMVCAVSAPSSLAVQLAAGVGMTLVGFLRNSGCNIYTGQSRVFVGEPDQAREG